MRLAGGAALSDVVQLGTGDAHTCARRRDGTVYCWGANDRGQLGDGLGSGSTSPSQVRFSAGSPVDDAIDLATGGRGGCIRRADGAPWCWGSNLDGEVGDGTTTDRRFATWSTALATPELAGPTPKKVDLVTRSAVGGKRVRARVTLEEPAPAGGMTVALSSDSSAAMVPASVTVPAGSKDATFTVATSDAVTATRPVTIAVAANGGRQSIALAVTEPHTKISSISCTPTFGRGGPSFTPTCSVALSRRAHANTTVTLSSSGSQAVFAGGGRSASISVAAGARAASFSVTTLPVTSTKIVEISAKADGGAEPALALTIHP